MRLIVIAAFTATFVVGSANAVESSHRDSPSPMTKRGGEIVVAQSRSCKAASSCREAVQMWCDGYSRADGDGDGVPCESVCRSHSQVEKLKEEIGC